MEETGTGFKELLGEHGGNPPVPKTSGYKLTLYQPCACGVGCEACKYTGLTNAVKEEWTVSSVELRIRGQFEEWVQMNARKAMRGFELDGDVEGASCCYGAYAGEYGAGHYFWGGRYIRSALKDLPGHKHLMLLCLRRCHPDLKQVDADRIFSEGRTESAAALRWALGGNL